MASVVLVLVVALGLGSEQHKRIPIKPRISALQGTVSGVSERILTVIFAGSPFPHGRQVDISSATYETADGKVVSPYPIHIGDRIIVVVDPYVPATNRPRKRKSGMNPMNIQLLPLRALVIELLSGSRHGPPPGSDKG